MIILDDSSRVKLKEIVGEDGSDYINASHLDVSSEDYHTCLTAHTCYTIKLMVILSSFFQGYNKTQGLHRCSRYIGAQIKHLLVTR